VEKGFQEKVSDTGAVLTRRKRLKHLLIAILVGFVLLSTDLGIKKIANNALEYNRVVNTGLPFLKLYLTHNKGYHYIFGKIPNHKLWSIGGLVFISFILVSIIKAIIKDKLGKTDYILYLIIVSLIIGATGNVWEIIFTGKATDYFIFKPFPWPSNLCDQYINAIQFIILPFYLIRLIIKPRKKAPKSPMI